ncbi:MAG: DUF3347 domain-containing protein [Candidatus Pseudobacter hemicellulosilyticus]|uniref:DUF3347 domain-containing protein n=1 Tax=Candidatus Pseudobacter hemicellulosilyticus TaxID=3121375 RepID=A0AAJ6BF60_9BACT|nr:MAG: DUF3347 domain-containing protein [Pseudobacter sp.]
MKKLLIAIVALGLIGFVAWKIWGGKADQPAEEKQQPLTVTEHSGAFNQSFHRFLTAYFDLKDALVTSDTGKASAAALRLATTADSLQINEIKGDSTGAIKLTAKDYAGTIAGSARAVAGEKDLKAKRKEFKMIAESMYVIIQTVRYDGQKVYWQYCPMAFDNQGAYWVSQNREVFNPYFGDEMLHCGSVEDSLDFSRR